MGPIGPREVCQKSPKPPNLARTSGASSGASSDASSDASSSYILIEMYTFHLSKHYDKGNGADLFFLSFSLE